jgi:predicted Rossmann fold nucleotide-binding protein DprA/Smf involved in DNA uptake
LTHLQTASTILVIFGSRSLTQQGISLTDRCDLVADVFSEADLSPDLIISGGADGGDAIAEALALRFSIPAVVLAVNTVDESTDFRRGLADRSWACLTVTEYGDDEPTDPTTGRGAYMTRNCLMAELTSRFDGAGLALWDGDSPGTQAMLASCQSHGVPCGIFSIPPSQNTIAEAQLPNTL